MNKKIKIGLIGLILALNIFGGIKLIHANAITDTVTEIGDQTGLTNYEGDINSKAIDQRGIRNITSGIYYLLDLVKYILAPLAILMIIIMGVSLVTSSDSESKLGEFKKYLGSIIIGLLLIYIADIAIQKVLFGERGEVYLSIDSIRQAALAGGYELKGIYTFIEILIGAISVLTMVIDGITMMLSTEDTTSQKKHLGFASVGLMTVGLSELFMKDIIFADYGTTINVAKANSLFASISNFAVSFIAIIAVAAFVYAGYLYVASYAAGEQNDKAKKAMIGAIVGILLAAGSYAVTKTLIQFQDSADQVSVREEILNS